MDFKKMRFDVSRAISTEELLTDLYPILSDYREFSNPDDNDILIIMLLMADEGSPFIKSYRDNFHQRLDKVYDHLDKNQDGDYVSILNGSCEVFNLMLFRWFTISDNLAYESWYSKAMNYHYMTQFLRQPPDFQNYENNMKARAQIEKEIDRIHKNLVEFEKQVFPDAITRKVVKEQVAKAVYYPEKFAEQKEDGFGNVRVI